MIKKTLILAAIAAAALGPLALSASAANVKITPLGGVTGEFCRLDRAMI